MKPEEKIADAMRMLGRGNGMALGGTSAIITADEIATVTKLRRSEVMRILVQTANVVWGKLPLGWTFDVSEDGTVRLQRRPD